MNKYCEPCRNVERAGIVVIYKNKILIVLGKVSNKWGLPKGELSNNETVIDAAIRELYEETGIHIDENMKSHLEPFFSTKYTHYFKFNLSNLEFCISPHIIDKKEIKKCKFASISSINNMYANHDLKYLFNNCNKLL